MSGAESPTVVDVRGLNCPIPLLKTRKALAGAASGASVVVLVTDPDSELDIRAYAGINGIECQVRGPTDGVWRFELTKS